MTCGTFADDTDWTIDDWCIIEVFYTNQQHTLCLTSDDVVSLVEGLEQWKQEKIIKDAKAKEAKEKQDYASYALTEKEASSMIQTLINKRGVK